MSKITELTKWLRENSSGVYRQAAEAAAALADVIEEQHSQIVDLEQENKRLTAVMLYLSHCHAANTEGGILAYQTDYDKKRFKGILEKAVKFMEGGWPHHYDVVEDPQKVIDRCRQGIERLDVK